MGGLEIEDIGDADDAAVSGLDSIIVGAPTWHTGEDEQRSGTEWDTWLYDTLPNLDLNGKNVAVFGCGDQASYSEYYCDPQVSSTTSSPGPAARSWVPHLLTDMTMKAPRRSVTASLLASCVTRTTNTTCRRTVQRPGSPSSRMRGSSK